MNESDFPKPDTSKLKELLAERRKKKESEAQQDEQYNDLIPDPGYEHSDSDKELDAWINRLSIIDAYNKWCGKSTPKPHPGQTESVMVSCPIPGHTDKHPSAWLNTEKKTWFCGGCQEGGDIYDLAAYYFSVPDYKSGANFPKLREKMAESFGFSFLPPAPGEDKPILIPPKAQRTLKVAPDLPPDHPEPEEESVATVTAIDGSDDEEFERELPTFDWKRLVESDTYIDAYMKATEPDDIPSEYNFWNALTSVGLALGRDVTLRDRILVQGNLYVCIVGYTGDGKSRSYRHMENVITRALPWNRNEDEPKGVQIIKGAGSGEVIVQSFSHMSDIGEKVPIRGLIHYDEMANFTSRSSRQGNTLKSTLQEIYDSPPTLGTRTKTGGIKGTPLVIEASYPFASAFASAQPAVFRKMFQEEDLDSGFLNRWVFITGEKKPKVSISDTVIDMTPAVSPLQVIHNWSKIGKIIEWSDAAHREFDLFYHDQIVPTQERDQTQLLARIDLTMKKIILNFAANELESEVQVSHVEKATSLFNYLTVIYNILGLEVRTSPYAAMQNDLINFIEQETIKNPHRGCAQGLLNKRVKRKGYDLTKAHRILDIAVKMNMITVIDERKASPGMGRPTIRYYSNIGG